MFCYLWNYARNQVQLADKISFVGLALHQFLEPGLRFLFREKTGPTQIVIENPDVQKYGIDDPQNICARTLDFLKKATNGQMLCLTSSIVPSPLQEPVLQKRKGITACSCFADFVANEL